MGGKVLCIFLCCFFLVYFCSVLNYNFLFSLQVWCYERLTSLAPHRKGRALFLLPFVERWKTSHTYSNAWKSISMFRWDLDHITAVQVKKILSMLVCFSVYLVCVFINVCLFYRLIGILRQLRS